MSTVRTSTEKLNKSAENIKAIIENTHSSLGKFYDEMSGMPAKWHGSASDDNMKRCDEAVVMINKFTNSTQNEGNKLTQISGQYASAEAQNKSVAGTVKLEKSFLD